MPKPFLIYCAYCGKDHTEVGTMIPGPNIAVCDECIELMYWIVQEEKAEKEEQRAERFRSAREKKPPANGG